MRQQQVPLQVLGEVLVCRRVVARAGIATLHIQPLIPLTPIVFVLTVVVVARLGDADLEEIGKVEHRARGRETTTRVAVDARLVDVDPAVALRQFLHPGHLIGQRVVAHVGVVGIVERLRTVGRPHAVDFDDDEAEFGQSLRLATGGAESPVADGAALRAWIDMVDNRIFLRRIEGRWLVHHAVDVGLPVAALHVDRGHRIPAGRHELGGIGRPLQRHHQRAGGSVAHGTRGRHIRHRPAVHQVATGRRGLHVVGAVIRRERDQVAAVEVYAIGM